MQVGTPVLATAVGAHPRGPRRRRAARRTGPSDIARGLGELLLGRHVAAPTLIARGRERVARYSWDRCADGLVAVYETIRGDR